MRQGMEELTSKKIIALEGKYVRLETISPKYFSQIVAWRNDESVKRYIVQPFLLTEELEAEWYANYLQEPGHLMFVMIAKTGEIPFGTLGYINHDKKRKICIGTHHLIGKEEYRASLEYAEAAILFHDYIFHNLGVEKMVSHIMVDNLRTASLLKKMGFQKNAEPQFPECLRQQGKLLEEYILTETEYSQSRVKVISFIRNTEENNNG